MHGAPIDPLSPVRSTIVFYLNGKRQTASGDTLQLTLAHWLRRHRGLVGTKVMCTEGDCGACSVLVGRPITAAATHLRYQAIDACIAFLFQIDRCHVVTVEGLATSRNADGNGANNDLTAIQRSMVDCHGSQCGFCTPGFIMTMHAMVEADQRLDDDTMRYGLSGNLCRCTGYVQILEAGRRAAEQIASAPAQQKIRLADRFDEAAMTADFRSLGSSPIESDGPHRTFIPQTTRQACEYRAAYPNAICVAGGTDYGVLRNHHRLAASDVIYLGQIDSNNHPSESNNAQRRVGFQDIVVSDGRLTIGGGATWSAIERAVAEIAPQYHHILTRFGSPQIRNMGTIGGNLASGSPIADSVPFHLVLDTELELASVRGCRRVRLEDFYQGYRQTVLMPDELIVSIQTRLPKKSERLRLFKISKRRDMDISTVTFAILANIANDQIVDAKVAVGGVGPQVMRMAPAEAFLRGKAWSPETLRAAGRMMRQQITPWTDVRGGANYRRQLVENLMVKSYYPFGSYVIADTVRGHDEQ